MSRGERLSVSERALRRMLPDQLDALPMPAAFQHADGRLTRYRWVGIGWLREGAADGTEPLVVTRE